MPKPSYICNCDVIHEDIVNDVKSKMQPKDDYIQLASLFKLFGDGTRVQILHALEQSEMCVFDLAGVLGGQRPPPPSMKCVVSTWSGFKLRRGIVYDCFPMTGYNVFTWIGELIVFIFKNFFYNIIVN